MQARSVLTVTALLAVSACAVQGATSPAWATRDLKAGIIGTDTSHVPAFTGLFARHPEWRVKVVAAFPAGSPDIPSSANRVEKYARQLAEKFGVEIVDSIAALLPKVDVVLIESVDGRPHLEQARPVFEAGKPMFIDKPFTASLADAREIVRLSKETGVPFFSSSCVRFQPEKAKFRHYKGVGKLLKAQGSSPLHIEPHHPDLFWYGIHGVEALYTVLGRGCVSVKRDAGAKLDITTGTWEDGTIGIFRGVRKGDYKPLIRVWGTEGEEESKGGYNYTGLVETMAEFFHTRKPPIDPLETLELIEFMTAAQLSKARGGGEVKLEELRKAE
ncbi:MAG: Gfo/Idh/MocA family protein [Planctomycetota bacterium]